MRYRRPAVAAGLLGLLLTTTSWPAGTAPAGAGPTPGPDPVPVAFVADSIGYDGSGNVEKHLEKGFDLAYDGALNGARIAWITDTTIDALREPDAPDIVLIVLGSAEAEHAPRSRAFRRDMRALLDGILPHVSCVRWFETQGLPAPYYEGFTKHHLRVNALIRQVAAEYEEVEYVHYSDWSTLVPAGERRGYFFEDGLHLKAKGEAELGRMLRQAALGCDPSTDVGGFWDVKQGAWPADHVAWLVDRGLASGYDNRTYRAEIGSLEFPVSRGQVLNMLWQLVGAPPGSPHGWSDGPPWLTGALDWAWADDVASGWPDGTFRPDRTLTRGQLVWMLWNLAGAPEVIDAHPWADGEPWLDGALRWAHAAGVAAGYPNGTFKPDRRVTRAEVAALLHGAAAQVTPPPAAPAPPEDPGPAPTTAPTSTLPPTTVPPGGPATTVTTTVPPTTTGPERP